MSSLVFKLMTLIPVIPFIACTGSDPSRLLKKEPSVPVFIKESLEAVLSQGVQNPAGKFASIDSVSKEFVTEMAIHNLMGVQASLLAKERSQDPSVRSFAETMINVHKEAIVDLKQFVSQKKIYLAEYLPPDQQQDIKKLYQLKGTTFDKTYISLIENNFRKAIALIKKASLKAVDADVKAYAQERIATFEGFYESAKSLNKTLKASSTQ